MTVTFRHFKEILEDWLSYVVGHSQITDTNPGSITRTYGEATSLEMARTYVELQNVLNLFSIDKASGDDLDERAQDFDLTRAQPTKSSGAVNIGDSNLTSGDIAVSTTKSALTAGVSTTVAVQDVDFASFPASGNVILDRSGTNRETVAYSSKTVPDTLNLVGNPVNSHLAGITVHLETVGADRPIPVNSVLLTSDVPALKFETTEAVTLYDGDYYIPNVLARSIETGAANNIASGKINRFESPPFPTATVTNPANFQGGADLESDGAFRARIKESQQALSSSTRLRIESEALQVQVESTGQRVITANVIEPIVPGESTLYINDGTSTYAPTTVAVDDTEFLLSVAEPLQRRGKLHFWPIVSNTEQIFVSLDRGTATSVGAGSLTDTAQSWTPNQYAGWKVKDENDVTFDIVSNTATVLTLSSGAPTLGAYAVWDPSATTYPTGSKLVKNTDYIINNTNGNIELDDAVFPTGLQQNDALIAFYNGVTSSYSYYDGLLQEVQKVMNGDPDDPDTYPGVIAAGTILNITTPSIVVVTVSATVSAITGVDESTIRGPVKTAILNYVNNLTIGEDVLVSSIIAAAKGVNGVFDFSLITPSGNVVITDAQIAKTTLSDITVT